jgi:hypothetical protein
MAEPLIERVEHLEYDMKCIVERLFAQNFVIEYKDGLAYINGNPYISLKALASKNKLDVINMINTYLLAAPKGKRPDDHPAR